MKHALTDPATKAMTLAEEAARSLNHEYIGTEHILLGLLAEGSCATAGVLDSLGLSIERVRAEIEPLRGPKPVSAQTLPLTPRAQRVLQYASELADNVSLSHIAPEHLLVGLIREPDGVAGQVMRNLGLNPLRVCEESLRGRKAQMRLVERAVRPVRAGVTHKRKMREELLAHLTAIYDEELEQSRDADAALHAAAERFGDPAELSRELQSSVPMGDRIAWRIERWLGWRPGESVLHMMSRTSFLSFCIIAIGLGLPILAGILLQGWDSSQRIALRTLVAMAIFTPLAQFGVGMCYYRMRDYVWGVFGMRKSTSCVMLWALLLALAVSASGLGFIFAMEGPGLRLADSLALVSFAGACAAVFCLAMVHLRGPREIRDTIWAMMEI